MNSLMQFDLTASTKLQLKPSSPFWKVAVFFAHSGDSWFWLAGLFIAWLLLKGQWHANAALMAIGVFGLAVLVMAIKFIVRRQRPEGEWGAVYRSIDPHSFPSGHAARAALLAIMAWNLGPAWFGWLVVLWMPLVSLARVMTAVHFLSDVIAGIALGLLAGVFMLTIQPVLLVLFPFLF